VIRDATLEDVAAIVGMGQRFIAGTPYARAIEGRPSKMAAFVERLITEPDGAIFVSEYGGVLVGMIGMVLFEHPFSGERVGSEMFWWVEPEHRGIGIRLYKRAETWAIAAGAAVIHMIAPTPDVAQLYTRLGFEYVEATYQRRV
jgi:GNAT superfamily N-acetyltransferase